MDEITTTISGDQTTATPPSSGTTTTNRNTLDILKNLKEKEISAMNDTNTDVDRPAIQKEIDQSLQQIDDNALTTFNGKILSDNTGIITPLALETPITQIKEIIEWDF